MKHSWPALYHCPGALLEELTKSAKPQGEQLSSGSEFEPRISRIRSRSENQSVATFPLTVKTSGNYLPVYDRTSAFNILK